MKTQLTADDPVGWYLCRHVCEGKSRLLWWDGSVLREDLSGESVSPAGFNEFVTLHTDRKLSKQNDELKRLNSELSALVALQKDTIDSYGTYLAARDNAIAYGDDRRKRLEAEVAELRTALAENEALVAESVKGSEQVNEELRTLREELSRLKSQPYPMRKADKPDCVGLWKDRTGDYIEFDDLDCSATVVYGPYYYIGPIPVVPQQLPPKVVRVQNMQGEVCDAILSTSGESYAILDADGRYAGNGSTRNWQEVQS